MTNEQLTQEVLRLSEEHAKAVAEHEKIEMVLKELEEDVKSTKTLAEDVHIMAINMKNMQKTLDDTSKKVDALASQEFVDYKENRKLLKNNFMSGISGAIITAVIGFVVFLVKSYVEKGGI